MDQCDERVLNIAAPHDFSRAPRSLHELPHCMCMCTYVCVCVRVYVCVFINCALVYLSIHLIDNLQLQNSVRGCCTILSRSLIGFSLSYTWPTTPSLWRQCTFCWVTRYLLQLLNGQGYTFFVFMRCILLSMVSLCVHMCMSFYMHACNYSLTCTCW